MSFDDTVKRLLSAVLDPEGDLESVKTAGEQPPTVLDLSSEADRLAVEIEKIWIGEMSMYRTSSGATIG